MSFDFTPSGAPISSSFSIRSVLTLSTSTGGFPLTSSLSGFASNTYGPQGPPYKIASGSDVTLQLI
jgi:hypothetical protein